MNHSSSKCPKYVRRTNIRPVKNGLNALPLGQNGSHTDIGETSIYSSAVFSVLLCFNVNLYLVSLCGVVFISPLPPKGEIFFPHLSFCCVSQLWPTPALLRPTRTIPWSPIRRWRLWSGRTCGWQQSRDFLRTNLPTSTFLLWSWLTK